MSDPDEVLLAQWARDGPPTTVKPVRKLLLKSAGYQGADRREL